MEWVTKRLKQREESSAHRQKVASGTEPMWQSLCQAIKDSIAAFSQAEPSGRFVEEPKNHHVYWIRYIEDTPQHGTEKKKVMIVLDAEESSIKASYTGVPFSSRSMKLDVEGGSVCIRNETGTATDSAEAAAYILDPFLFPDLAATPIPSDSNPGKIDHW